MMGGDQPYPVELVPATKWRWPTNFDTPFRHPIPNSLAPAFYPVLIFFAGFPFATNRHRHVFARADSTRSAVRRRWPNCFYLQSLHTLGVLQGQAAGPQCVDAPPSGEWAPRSGVESEPDPATFYRHHRPR